jgi:hypothetical protein
MDKTLQALRREYKIIDRASDRDLAALDRALAAFDKARTTHRREYKRAFKSGDTREFEHTARKSIKTYARAVVVARQEDKSYADYLQIGFALDLATIRAEHAAKK